MSTPARPTLLYDGACGFCRRWIERWRDITGDRVAYATSSEAGHRYPRVDPETFSRTVVFVDVSGAVFVGAEAVFRALAAAPGWSGPLWLYRKLPGFAPSSEWLYALVARNRMPFSRVTGWLWGGDLRLPRYQLVRWLFLRGLGVVYLIAFVSLWLQLDGLVGQHGVSPAHDLLATLTYQYGRAAYFQAPSLFWLGVSDTAIATASLAGAAAALLLIVNRLPWLAAATAWLLYLSLYGVGGVFMSYQWDILLLETGFLALLLAPCRARPRLRSDPPVSRTAIFLLRWLVFRLMLLSGVVKLASGDPAWWDLSALTYHYETQPIPAWTSWYVHNLPGLFHYASCAVMFAIEIVLPFFVFGPRRLRLVAASGFLLLQFAIMATGNYNFFNLLTCLLCVTLLDDALLARVLPARLAREAGLRTPGSGAPRASSVLAVNTIAVALVVLGSFHAWGRLAGYASLPPSVRRVVAAVAPFHLANAYGLFAAMTKHRREIVIEGSDDGAEWKAYGFRWKPGDPMTAPRFCQPHQPRLDWQMWFAALGSYRGNPWLTRLMQRILEGSPAVLKLLGADPFPERPPRYLRATIYDYEMTTITARRATGAWWERGAPRAYSPVMTLPAD